MRARTWNLRLNLDALNSAFTVLQDDTEKAHFISGLVLGANGGMPRGDRSAAFIEGFTIGAEMRTETEAYRKMQQEKGMKGGTPSWKTKHAPLGTPVGGGLVNHSDTPSDYGSGIKDSLSREECTGGYVQPLRRPVPSPGTGQEDEASPLAQGINGGRR